MCSYNDKKMVTIATWQTRISVADRDNARMRFTNTSNNREQVSEVRRVLVLLAQKLQLPNKASRHMLFSICGCSRSALNRLVVQIHQNNCRLVHSEFSVITAVAAQYPMRVKSMNALYAESLPMKPTRCKLLQHVVDCAEACITANQASLFVGAFLDFTHPPEVQTPLNLRCRKRRRYHQRR